MKTVAGGLTEVTCQYFGYNFIRENKWYTMQRLISIDPLFRWERPMPFPPSEGPVELRRWCLLDSKWPPHSLRPTDSQVKQRKRQSLRAARVTERHPKNGSRFRRLVGTGRRENTVLKKHFYWRFGARQNIVNYNSNKSISFGLKST